MSINLEIPGKLRALADQAHRVAAGMFRPISREYDRREHEFPEQLRMLGAVLRGISESTGVGAGGLSDKQIAQHLSLSIRTVQTHLTNVYGKLGVDGRGGLRQLSS